MWKAPSPSIPWGSITAPAGKPAPFTGCFPTLKQLNVPPQLIQRLLDNLDIRLVFTAHPTEIVRHTIRDKQRRIAALFRQMDRAEESLPRPWTV
jgi:phosphoenolpyruvate carboxylase